MVDGTPIYDIKPYLPYADSIPEAVGGFAPDAGKLLEVRIAPEFLDRVPEKKKAALLSVLARDPRPQYQKDPDREYGLSFAGLEIRFRVEKKCLTVTRICQTEEKESDGRTNNTRTETLTE